MSEEEEITAKQPRSCIPVRHVQAFMLFLAMVLGLHMRINMSMAIVSMTDPENDNAFDWSSQRQGVILSSFFWGYVVLQIPGGELIQRFGGKILLSLCIGLNSAICLLIPTAGQLGGWKLVCACRVMQGLCQGFLIPSIHSLIAKWAPVEEKSRVGTFIYSGSQFGTATQMLISGFISQYWGWPAIFYVNGVLGALWTVCYVFIGSSSPQTSKIISDEEKLYIQNSLGHVGGEKILKTPWRTIFTSKPFIALIIAHCGHSWGFWTLMTLMPSFMRQALGVDITANGVMSAMPYLTMYLLSFPFGITCDYVLKKQWLSITACRKISNTIGQWGSALALIGLAYAPAGNLLTEVVILCIVVGINAGHFTGFLLVHIDMAPNFGGTMMGITNFFAHIIAIIAPLVAGAILTDQTNVDQWKIVFFIATFFYFLGNLVFLIFGSSERQEWNEPKDDLENDNNKMTSMKRKWKRWCNYFS